MGSLLLPLRVVSAAAISAQREAEEAPPRQRMREPDPTPPLAGLFPVFGALRSLCHKTSPFPDAVGGCPATWRPIPSISPRSSTTRSDARSGCPSGRRSRTARISGSRSGRTCRRSLVSSTTRRQRHDPHFLGAVVLEQALVQSGKIHTRSVIDGQQRLTALPSVRSTIVTRRLTLTYGLVRSMMAPTSTGRPAPGYPADDRWD